MIPLDAVHDEHLVDKSGVAREYTDPIQRRRRSESSPADGQSAGTDLRILRHYLGRDIQFAEAAVLKLEKRTKL